MKKQRVPEWKKKPFEMLSQCPDCWRVAILCDDGNERGRTSIAVFENLPKKLCLNCVQKLGETGDKEQKFETNSAEFVAEEKEDELEEEKCPEGYCDGSGYVMCGDGDDMRDERCLCNPKPNADCDMDDDSDSLYF